MINASCVFGIPVLQKTPHVLCNFIQELEISIGPFLNPVKGHSLERTLTLVVLVAGIK